MDRPPLHDIASPGDVVTIVTALFGRGGFTITCPTCEGSGIYHEDHGQGMVERLGCPDCAATGRLRVTITGPDRDGHDVPPVIW